MTTTTPSLGFIGLGTMGEPMALNLRQAGIPLTVWNRSADKSQRLAETGASVAATPQDVFTQCDAVILMMADSASMDLVLGRATPTDFHQRVNGRLVISMGTFTPEYSQQLGEDIRTAGGRYVEAPVSGSRKPAEAGQLVAMLAGDAADVAAVRPLLSPMCREAFECGAVPGALRMKLAVNTFLITMVTGLAEAAHFANRHGLDMERFIAILDAGPMASDVSRIKGAKLRTGDFARQASITDVFKNSRLVVEAARLSGIPSPLMDVCVRLYEETEALGFGDEDMVAVVKAIDART